MESGDGSLAVPKVFGLQPPGLWAEILVGQTGFGSNTVVALSHPYFCILEKSFQRDFSQHQVAGGEMPQVAKRSQGVSAHLC